MGKRYQSFDALVDGIVGDEARKKKVQETIELQSLGATLSLMRNHHGFTQEELANRLGVKQNKVSRLEHTDFPDFKLGDLLAYSRGLGMEMVIMFNKPGAAGWVRLHIDQIQNYLKDLRDLSGDDQKLIERVAEWSRSTFKEVLRVFADHGSKLAKPPKEDPVVIIAAPELIGGEADPTVWENERETELAAG